jgi:PAS domain S-box-containing protein
MTTEDFEGLVAAMVQVSADAVFAATPEGLITLWSPAAERTFGVGAGDAIGQPTALVLPDLLPGDEQDLVSRASRGEIVTRRSAAGRAQGGRALDLWLSAAPVRAADGSISGVLLVARDLAEARRGAVEQARLAAIVDSSDDAIISKTLSGVITSWNRGAEGIFGYSAAEVVGQSIRIIIPPERQGEEDHVLGRISRGESVDHFDTVRVRKDGSRVFISLTVSPVRDDTGRIVGASKIARDVTARIQMEQQQAALYEEARQANRAKDEFLAMLGHELRNPLGAITSAVHLLGRGAPDRLEPTSIARDVIDRQARHLARLVDDLLDVGRVITGKILLNRQPLDLAEAVTRSLRGLRATGRLDQHDVAVETAPVWIDADTVRVEQIVDNLVGNALKYTPPGGRIRVGVRQERGDAVLDVQDTGVGIPADLLPRIFDLFAQGAQRLDRARGGLGIGLTLVKRLVELHGASVQAVSEGTEKGSRFTVSFRAIAPALGRSRAEVGAAPSPAPGSRRVLLIEDNADARQMMRLLLEQAGHVVYEEIDGLRGIEAAVRLTPDVAIVDIGLPGLDGYAVARQVRQRLGRDIRLVALTGYGRSGDRDRALGAGFDMYMVKPIEPAALQEIVGLSRD